MMNIILLSGGSGQRLWPLSNNIRSKQFIKLFQKEDGSYESMMQRVYRQMKASNPDARITIATSKSQVSAIYNQLGKNVGVCVEPARRDTFPAIALATAFLHDVEGVDEGDTVVVCPVDPYVEADYFKALNELWKLADTGAANLLLMGIVPTYPSEKYGYIIPETPNKVSRIHTFKEKPDAITAQAYIQGGALWNGGVFAYKLGYVIEKMQELEGISTYEQLYRNYEKLTKVSFDYAVAETEANMQVMRFEGQWKDIGTWNTLAEEMSEKIMGLAMYNESCENINVINELDIPILCMGLTDVIISASSDGILVSDKEQSSYIKPFVERMEQRVMFAEKSWGSYTVLDVGEESLTVKVILQPGHKMSYHSHDCRDEVWTIVSGNGRTIVDGIEEIIHPGDVITMESGCKHTIIADTKLTVMEVQLGKENSVYDKHKHEFPA